MLRFSTEYPNGDQVVESQISINDRVRGIQNVDYSPHKEPELTMERIEESNEVNDEELVTESVVQMRPKPMETNKFEKALSLPAYRRNQEVFNEIEEIDDLESVHSGSKLTLNDPKSDSEDVIQELNKLNLDLEENDRYPPNYRKRGQSWSNWDNNVPVDLNAEVCFILFNVFVNHFGSDCIVKS